MDRGLGPKGTRISFILFRLSVFSLFLMLTSASILGLRSGATRAETETGSAWEARNLGYWVYDDPRYAVQVTAEGTLWALGHNGSVLVSQDMGKTWLNRSPFSSAWPNRNYPRLSSLHALSGDLAWALGPNKAYRTVDGGRTWEERSAGIPSSVFLEKVSAFDPQVAWAAGPFCLYRTTDGGMSWREIYRNPTSYGIIIYDMHCTGRDSLLSLGVYSEADSTRNVLYQTVDGGVVWTEIPCPKPPSGRLLYDLEVGKDGSIWLYNHNMDVYRSTDGGMTWTRFESPEGVVTAEAHLCIRALRADLAFATLSWWSEHDRAHHTYTYKTTPGSAGWSKVGSYLYGMRIMCLDLARDGSLMLAGAKSGDLLVSMNGGENWACTLDTRLGKEDDIVSVCPLGGLNAYAATGGIIFRTRDGGLTWSEVIRAYPYGITISDLEALNERTLWSVGSQSGGGVIYRSDIGAMTAGRLGDSNTTFQVTDSRASPPSIPVTPGSAGPRGSCSKPLTAEPHGPSRDQAPPWI